ncbi:tetraacyldisaccharide 4'-kinase [Neoasaia chiangmaiensis NBRC 101099]|uniref:Tetraacyldisaccharide 4'-kinase n=1 Tax=Neoasaia chiangmaiensis TaxID=320497 RepID=A0A1U9KN96_9PROT|nr:tetraacyldisaccharide 4'-kinase [Neoasaia chiangmaiensis]AQS87267.1 tetraacyldisaccharide 4'-kinase [Neoasaia chiangmaiensis]GBR38504.1 tetraacyldisaccharide 4'-kinase [Neoasaia chiangmaiensis NBRC 101099]GEN15866.1 tetraacyldisaccharide 4'-kinase [Neoasaia chiangmaiensis]
MRINPPEFWTQDRTSLRARLLTPLSSITQGIGLWRARRAAPVLAGVPVLCCGNLTMGGAGKTTLALDLGRRLKAQGHRPHFLTRGYGGTTRGPLRVDGILHDAETVGDEPLLLAQVAPTWVGRDRAATAQEAVAAGADCLILDDGLQNHTLHQDMRIVTVDGATGFGNGKLFPAGPLREPVAAGLSRADAIVMIGRDDTRLRDNLPAQIPYAVARLVPGPEIRRLQGRRVIAFAGIARPTKFFDTLTEAGIQPLRCLSFPDHHRYGERDLKRLARLRLQEGVTLVTTAKDAVKLPAWLRQQVTVINIELLWSDPGAPEELLNRLWIENAAA